jgi:hypothetical protein
MNDEEKEICEICDLYIEVLYKMLAFLDENKNKKNMPSDTIVEGVEK